MATHEAPEATGGLAPGEPAAAGERVVSIPDSAFWEALMDDIYGPREGGAIILVDAEDARKGVGKTSCAVGIARLCAEAFDYEMVEDDLILSGERYLNRMREHPGSDQPSVVVWDEAVGAGSGDARRSMAEQNRIMGQAWQMMRTKRIVSIATLPDWGELDVRLRKYADFRIWCRRSPIGRFRAYQIGTSFDDGNLKPRGLGGDDRPETVAFPNMDALDDPLFDYLTSRKERLISQTDTFDADDALAPSDDDEDVEGGPDATTIRRQKDIAAVLRAVRPWDEDGGVSQYEASDIVDRSQPWVSKRIREWRKGKHRDLLDGGVTDASE